ncbi:hypothetical protein V2J09_003193 [Rumex salicifolius]
MARLRHLTYIPPGGLLIISLILISTVTLRVNGKRQIFICGEIHYPRVRPEMWDDILTKARRGGLNCLQTYVFWNAHEPIKGQYNFTGGLDLVLFIKKAAEMGMYTILRIGPFIQAEWNYGDTKNMKAWTTRIVKMMKEEKLYASQGGPIILSQIENEYDHVKGAFRKYGQQYIKWAAQMALDQQTKVPWLMCKQKDAPYEVINACNGRHCGDTFTGPNTPTKPMIWTENWTAQYRVFGDPPSRRGAEDIAYSVARWFSMNGSHVGYYMFYGGTNYGRTAAAFVTTRYYDEAPLDEFGLEREPKYSHLRDLHFALHMCTPGLWGDYSVTKYDADTETCVAFLSNNNTEQDFTIKFRGKEYFMPAKSISILPDCKTNVYNTRMMVSQHNARNFTKSESVHKDLQWEMITEPIPELGGTSSTSPLEQFGFAKDTTDYVWYMTSIELDAYDLPFRKSIQPVLDVVSLGHGILVFVNGKFVGSEHGSKQQPKFTYRVPIQLHQGVNHFAFLQASVGMPDSGSYMEHRFTGLRSLVIQGLGAGNLDLTNGGWKHKSGLEGERLEYFTEEGSKKAKWVPLKRKSAPMTWYKATFDAPPGDDPLAIRMDNMTKGMVWVNGNSIGRYWTTYLSPLMQPSQSEYHIPRTFIKPKDNLIVIFDELGGLVEEVDILVVKRDVVCCWTSENYPAHVSTWKWDDNVLKPKDDTKPKSVLQCPNDHIIKNVDFASFGDPWGTCGLFMTQACHAKHSAKIVEELCLGKNTCEIPVDRDVFQKDGDPCPLVKEKILAVQLKCGPKND